MTSAYPVSERLLWTDRILYFIGLPALLFNYGAASVISLILGASSGASQLSLLIYLLFIFPVALVAMICLVWAQFTAHIKVFSANIRAALVALLLDILLIGLFVVPNNDGTALKPVAHPGSVLTHVLGVSVSSSDAISNVLIFVLPAIMVWLIVVSIIRARANSQEFEDSLMLR